MSAATGRAERSEGRSFPRDCIIPAATACVPSPGTRTVTRAETGGNCSAEPWSQPVREWDRRVTPPASLKPTPFPASRDSVLYGPNGRLPTVRFLRDITGSGRACPTVCRRRSTAAARERPGTLCTSCRYWLRMPGAGTGGSRSRPAISTRKRVRRTSSSSARSCSRPTAPPARARSPTNCASSGTPPPTG